MLHILLCILSVSVSLILLMWLTLHLDQELCLDAAGGLALILVPGAAQ